MKATDDLRTHAGGATIPLRVETADLRAWLMETLPVVLVQYDAQQDRAFWLDVKEYARVNDLHEDPGGETVTLHIPTAGIWDEASMQAVRSLKEQPRRPSQT